MSAARTLVGRVFVVEWDRRDAEELRRTWSELEQAFHRTGEPLLYVGVMTERTAPGTREYHDAMADFVKARVALCHSVYMIVEGNGAERVEERARVATTLRAGNLKPIVAKSALELLRLASRQVRDELKLALDVALNGVQPSSGHFRTSRTS
jgi:hypothetical protein